MRDSALEGTAAGTRVIVELARFRDVAGVDADTPVPPADPRRVLVDRRRPTLAARTVLHTETLVLGSAKGRLARSACAGAAQPLPTLGRSRLIGP